jgi:phosphohistidine phosphatase SixA
LLPPAPATASEEAWSALARGGTVALMRHARAPGTGDPAGFRLEDCTTQRNLSDDGRAQARRIGEAFRQRRIAVASVLSSRWCRALDTARLAFGDAVRPFPPLDSFFAGRGSSEEQTQGARREIAAWQGREGVLVMVTHQVNITALTGIFPQEGEAVVLAPASDGSPRVLGTVRP